MRAELLNPFIKSFHQAISMFLGNSPEKKKVEALNSLNFNANVHVFLGIAGDLSGTVFFSATKENALRLASAMAGMPFAEFDDIAASALQELLNITSGGAATEFSQMGIHTEITPPTFVTGEKIDIRLSFPIISVHLFVFDSVQVFLNLSVKTRTPNRVLVVESSTVLRSRVVNTLKLNGFEVLGEFSSSLECLKHIETNNKNKADIIICDVSKSAPPEIQDLKQIKQIYPQVKIIAATALGQSIDREISPLVDDYLTKPFEDKTLLDKVKKLFKG